MGYLHLSSPLGHIRPFHSAPSPNHCRLHQYPQHIHKSVVDLIGIIHHHFANYIRNSQTRCSTPSTILVVRLKNRVVALRIPLYRHLLPSDCIFSPFQHQRIRVPLPRHALGRFIITYHCLFKLCKDDFKFFLLYWLTVHGAASDFVT